MEMGTIIGEQGCHLTWPELRHLTEHDLSLSWKVIRDRRLDYNDLPSYYCSMTNLKGFIRYNLGNHAQAEKIFRDLLEIDVENICALGNLAVLCYRQTRLAHHNEYVERLRKVIARRASLTRARSYYDRAHTIRHFEQDKRKFTYIPFIKKAVEISKDLEVREKNEWLFDFGLALYRKDCQFKMGSASEATLEAGFRDACKCFHEVIALEGNLGNRALSWVFLGILLRNHPSRSFEKSLPTERRWHGLSALDCFNESLKLHPKHPIVTRRVGAEMTKLGEFERAQYLLDTSIDAEISWFAYRHRGLLNIARYESSSSNEKLYLIQARSDFEAAMQRKQVHADYSDLGYVLFLIEDYPAALNQFSLADRCTNNDNFNPVVTHQRWAKCLRAIGETNGALKQEEKAMEVENMLARQAISMEEMYNGHGQNCQGFECDLERFNYSSEERDGFVNILSEENYPLSSNPYIFLPTRHSKYKYDFFVSFAHIDHKWTLLFFRKLERELGIKGCIRYRDYECGNAISANITYSIHQAAKILMIISPDSLTDQWCRYEVQKALAESLMRTHVSVIPIMLRPCRIPDELELMTYIKCQDGQFTADDWYRLGKGLMKKI